MKNILFVLLFSIVFSCENDDKQGGDIQLVNEEFIFSIDEVKNFLPEEYFSETSIVYTNNNEELILFVDPIESKHDLSYSDGSTHESETFEIILYNPEDINFQIVITASPNLPDGNTSKATLNNVLMPFNESGSSWNTIRFENEEAIISFGDDFHSTLELSDRIFTDVYKRRIFPSPNNPNQEVVYSELDINSNEGVVAFRDANNELWVFDRFIE